MEKESKQPEKILKVRSKVYIPLAIVAILVLTTSIYLSGESIPSAIYFAVAPVLIFLVWFLIWRGMWRWIWRQKEKMKQKKKE